MRLIHVTINNMGGIAHWDGPLPAVTILDGANGAGKSSFENCIKYAAGRRLIASGARGVEHDPSMLYGDAERGECILTFDDDPTVNLKSLKCVIDTGTTTRWTRAADSTKYVKAGAELDEYFNAMGYDPFKLKLMAPRDRVEHLLRILPSVVTVAEIKEAVGDVVPCEPRPTIDAVQALIDDLFAKRTDVNRDVVTLKNQVELLFRAPGAEAGQDWAGALAALRKRQKAMEDAEQAQTDALRKSVNDERTAASEERRTTDIKINAAIDKEIAALNKKRDTQLQASLAAMNTRIETAKNAAQEQADAFIQEHTPQFNQILADITEAETRAKVQHEAEGVRKAAEKTQQQAKDAEERSQLLTDAIERLRKLKIIASQRMDLQGAVIASPKPGLPVDLCREENGALIGFDRWNDSDKDLMCLRIALKSQGRCGLIIVDSIANFDDEGRERLKLACQDYAKEAGISFIVGKPSAGPLKVQEWR